MIWRRILLTIAKYTAALLCLITVLLTTPWGSYLTIALLNNSDHIAIEYKSGSLVRDIELHSFKLTLNNITISLQDVATELDFACTWKKLLCVKSLKAQDFSLYYINDTKKAPQEKENQITNNQIVTLPFVIQANVIELKNSLIVVNETEIAINQLKTGLAIRKSEFKLINPTINQLLISVETNSKKSQTANSSSNSSLADTMANLPKISLPLALIIQQLTIDNIEVNTKNCQDNSCQYWLSLNNKLSATWVNTEVNIRQFQTKTVDFSINQLETKATLIPPYQVNSRVKSELHNVSWWPEIANTDQNINIKGSLENLSFDLSSQGSLILNSHGKVNLIDTNLPFEISLNASQIPLPLSLTPYGDPSSLSFTSKGDLNAQTIELVSELNSYGYKQAKVVLSAKHQQSHFTIDKLLLEDKETLSHLSLHGDLAILSNEISWQLSANSTGFSIPKINLTNVYKQSETDHDKTLTTKFPDSITGRFKGEISSQGSWSDTQWDISLKNTHIVGDINNNDLIFKADIGLNKTGQFTPGQLLLAFNDSELTLQTGNAHFWDIQGQLSIENISHWSQTISGKVNSQFFVTGDEQNPVISTTSKITHLNWQQWQGDAIDIQGRYQPFKDHDIELSIKNNQLHWANESNNFTLADFLFTIKGNAKDHHVSATWLGDLTGNLALTGHWNTAFTQWQSTVAQSQLSYRDAIFQNDHTFAINVDLGTFQASVDKHCWQSSGVSACLHKKAKFGEVGDISVKLNLDLSMLDNLFLPDDLELISQLNGNLYATWSDKASLNAKAHFSLSSGFLKINDDFNDYHLSEWSKGDFSFNLNEQIFTSSIQLLDVHDMPLMKINSNIDLLDETYPLNAKINLNKFNLQPFRAILNDVVDLQGKISANIAINGNVNSPLVVGDISLKQGKLRLSKNTNTFDDINSQITINNNQAQILGTFAIENKAANITGDIAWDDSLQLNMHLNAQTLPLIFPPQLSMNISPDLYFSLINKTLTITGDIDVLDGNYNIETLPEGSVAYSDDVIIVNANGQEIVQKTSGIDIKTNIRVNIANAFSISGQGLDSHLSGQLQINQQEKQPFQLFGTIQSYDGTFQAYGQNLTIEKGEVTFNGPMENPYVNLRASRHIKAEDIDVGMQIIGLADALDMQLFSTPSMERPEMLSYLVRGRGLDANTDNDTAVINLLVGYGVSNSASLFNYIEKVPFLSNIAVDTEGDGDKMQATISGYVGEKIYLKYGIGVYEPINELTVRMYLLNRFWLEIISGLEQSTDIYYSFDID